MLQQECSVFMGENMKLNEIYYEEFLNRAEELEAVEQEIEISVNSITPQL